MGLGGAARRPRGAETNNADFMFEKAKRLNIRYQIVQIQMTQMLKLNSRSRSMPRLMDLAGSDVSIVAVAIWATA